MKFLSAIFSVFIFLLAGCVSDSGKDTHEIKIDAFSDYLLYLKSNSTAQADTLVVKVFPSPVPLPIGMGDADTLILYKKGYDVTAGLPSHVIDTEPMVSILSVIYKYVYYASDAQSMASSACRIDNRGKKFLKEAAYDTSDVFQERLYDGTTGYYRLVDTTQAVTAFPCSFNRGTGFYVDYGKINSNLAVPAARYYGDIIIQY